MEITQSKKKPKGFWAKLPKPFFALAPMSDVTDIAFRQIIAKYSAHGKAFGGPDVFWTEFISCDGLCSLGGKHMLRDLEYDKKEKPIVAQVFGSNPDTFYKTAQIIKKLGFDGIDINMGCPDRKIEKQGAGASLMKNPKLATEIIYATKEGSGDMSVSVKTRIGYNKNQIEEWVPTLLETDIAAITIHTRTRKEMSLVPANWEHIARAVHLAKKTNTLIIGNGGIKSLAEGQQKARETDADGIMIGCGIFGNPWFFNSRVSYDDIPLIKRLETLVEHANLFEKKLGDIKNFAIMKKHFKAYVTGFDGAKELRQKLMETNNAKEVENVIKTYKKF
ncbi:tRNA-dihydrouridine synthase [Patescibacteria group bacterium]|nr:tRNA-dihydrouridine synthase [Patescibacteria group bacterium]MBU1246408.1 tRNA-dihydrouridine synthase [Patescibacteria group bacterium]MBU1519751.1 tRNA-dihydrouridine synthase [Patescibacteria group bacterium]MBU1956577.1 tRNA-dihydrouridine synthase [Patescibacteria group bacterium]MBU2416865.1 tRNA-dihydrouridine synthase [Patescibacteria group bacterium]